MSQFSDSSLHTSADINLLHCRQSSPVKLTVLQRLCHRLAMQLLLCEDELLEEVFTVYLQLPVSILKESLTHLHNLSVIVMCQF